MRQIIIGDIHGCFDELMQLLQKLELSDQDLLISVGDLVDRGPKSLEVYEYFRNRPNSIVVMGNHERKHMRGVLSYSQEIVKLQCGEKYSDMIEWFGSLPYYYETEKALIVHAAVEHDIPLEQQREDVLSGTTSGDKHLQQKYTDCYWSDKYDWDKPIVCGHHVVGEDVQITNEKVYSLDTGACHGMRLSALVLPDFEVVSVKCEHDYWKGEMRKWQLPVLKAKPWKDYTLTKIDKLLNDFSRKQDEDVRDYVSGIQQWRDAVPGLFERVISVIEAEIRSEFGQLDKQEINARLQENPYKRFFYQALKKQLDKDVLVTSINTPAGIVSLCDYFGVDHKCPF